MPIYCLQLLLAVTKALDNKLKRNSSGKFTTKTPKAPVSNHSWTKYNLSQLQIGSLIDEKDVKILGVINSIVAVPSLQLTIAEEAEAKVEVEVAVAVAFVSCDHGSS